MNAKTAPPFLIASLRSDSSERAEEMRSKAEEEGKDSVSEQCQQLERTKDMRPVEVRWSIPSLRDIVYALPLVLVFK